MGGLRRGLAALLGATTRLPIAAHVEPVRHVLNHILRGGGGGGGGGAATAAKSIQGRAGGMGGREACRLTASGDRVRAEASGFSFGWPTRLDGTVFEDEVLLSVAPALLLRHRLLEPHL